MFAENAAGAVTSSITFAGTYTVNLDCTGSLTFTDNRGRTGHRAMAIVLDGREIDYMADDTTRLHLRSAQTALGVCFQAKSARVDYLIRRRG